MKKKLHIGTLPMRIYFQGSRNWSISHGSSFESALKDLLLEDDDSRSDCFLVKNVSILVILDQVYKKIN